MRVWRAEQWQEVRAKGKPSFLFRYGFLGRGLPLGTLAALAVEVVIGTPVPDALTSPSFVARLVACIAVFSLSGSIMANANWNLHEKRHARGAS